MSDADRPQRDDEEGGDTWSQQPEHGERVLDAEGGHENAETEAERAERLEDEAGR